MFGHSLEDILLSYQKKPIVIPLGNEVVSRNSIIT